MPYIIRMLRLNEKIERERRIKLTGFLVVKPTEHSFNSDAKNVEQFEYECIWKMSVLWICTTNERNIRWWNRTHTRKKNRNEHQVKNSFLIAFGRLTSSIKSGPCVKIKLFWIVCILFYCCNGLTHWICMPYISLPPLSLSLCLFLYHLYSDQTASLRSSFDLI